ncbi:MAG: PilN domain-containing protein [Planctomycetota bacterium]
MTQVDFLPESYHRARQHRGRVTRQVVLVASVAACLIAGTVVLKAHSINQSRTADRLEATVQSEQTAMGVITGLDHERKQLLKTFDLKQELNPSVKYATVLAYLGEALPQGVAVAELSMLTVRPKPEPVETENASGRKGRGEDEEQVQEPHLIGIELQGFAPDDLSVALLVSALDEHPLFSRVTMRSSEGVNLQGLMAREFSLTATVDLDREFRWISRDVEEVAHAE